MKKRSVAILNLFFVLLFCAAGYAEDRKPIKIGILAPLSGELALFGTKTYDGVRIAMSEFNPQQVTVVTEDVGSATNADVAKATSKLLAVDKVDIVIGLIYLDQTLIAAPLTEAAHVPFFTISLCSSRFKNYKQVSCSYSSTEEQLAPLVPLLNKLKVNTLGLLVENSTYGVEADDIVKKDLAPTPIKIIQHEEINPEDQDFRSLLPRLLAAKPDAVFAVTADPAQSFLLFKMLHDQRYEGTRIGYLDIDPKYIQEFGKSIEGVYLPGFIAPDYSKQFVDRFNAAYHREPDMYAALGYDLFRDVAKAATETRDAAGELYKRVLAYHYADPAVPGYHYRPDGTISLPITVLQVKNGQYVQAQ